MTVRGGGREREREGKNCPELRDVIYRRPVIVQNLSIAVMFAEFLNGKSFKALFSLESQEKKTLMEFLRSTDLSYQNGSNF